MARTFCGMPVSTAAIHVRGAQRGRLCLPAESANKKRCGKIFPRVGKPSGYGKELSKLGIQEFFNRKLVLVPEGRSLAAEARGLEII
jgi:hypothetical protein